MPSNVIRPSPTPDVSNAGRDSGRWTVDGTNNPYGATAEQQADIARYVDEVEPLIRRSQTLELDGLLPIRDLADRVERCLRSTGQDEGPPPS